VLQFVALTDAISAWPAMRFRLAQACVAEGADKDAVAADVKAAAAILLLRLTCNLCDLHHPFSLPQAFVADGADKDKVAADVKAAVAKVDKEEAGNAKLYLEAIEKALARVSGFEYCFVC
jgi:hypothetical protein